MPVTKLRFLTAVSLLAMMSQGVSPVAAASSGALPEDSICLDIGGQDSGLDGAGADGAGSLGLDPLGGDSCRPISPLSLAAGDFTGAGLAGLDLNGSRPNTRPDTRPASSGAEPWGHGYLDPQVSPRADLGRAYGDEDGATGQTDVLCPNSPGHSSNRGNDCWPAWGGTVDFKSNISGNWGGDMDMHNRANSSSNTVVINIPGRITTTGWWWWEDFDTGRITVRGKGGIRTKYRKTGWWGTFQECCDRGLTLSGYNDTIGNPDDPDNLDQNSLEFLVSVGLGGGDDWAKFEYLSGSNTISGHGGKDTVIVQDGSSGNLISMGDGGVYSATRTGARSSMQYVEIQSDTSLHVQASGPTYVRIKGNSSSEIHLDGSGNRIEIDGELRSTIHSGPGYDYVKLGGSGASSNTVNLEGGRNILVLDGGTFRSEVTQHSSASHLSVILENGAYNIGTLPDFRKGDTLRGDGVLNRSIRYASTDNSTVIGIHPGGADKDISTTGDNPSQAELSAANSLVFASPVTLGGGGEEIWAKRIYNRSSNYTTNQGGLGYPGTGSLTMGTGNSTVYFSEGVEGPITYGGGSNSLTVKGQLDGKVTLSGGWDAVWINGGRGGIDLGAGYNRLFIESGNWSGDFTASNADQYRNDIDVANGATISGGAMTLQPNDRLTGGGTINRSVTFNGSTGAVTIGKASGQDSELFTLGGVINLGSGNNLAYVESVTAGGGITTGGGADTIDVKKTHDGSMNTGGGNDTITVRGQLLSGGGIIAGAGNDTLALPGGTAGVVNMGGGNDTVNVTGGMTAGSITLGDGYDIVTVQGGGGFAGGSLSMGDGNDRVTIHSGGGGNVALGPGQDTLNIESGTWTGALTVSGSNTVVVKANAVIGAGTAISLQGGDNIKGAGTISRAISFANTSVAQPIGTRFASDNMLTLDGAMTLGAGRRTIAAKTLTTNGSIRTTAPNSITTIDLSGAADGDIELGSVDDDVRIAGGSGEVDLGGGSNYFEIKANSTWSGTFVRGGATTVNTINIPAGATVGTGGVLNLRYADVLKGEGTIGGRIVLSYAAGAANSAARTFAVGSSTGATNTKGYFTFLGNVSLGRDNTDILQIAGKTQTGGAIIGGNKADTVTFAESIGAIVNMQGGNDTITAASVASGGSITAGAGNDTVTISGNSAGTIRGSGGNDTITISGSMTAGTITLGSGTSTLTVTGTLGGNLELGIGWDTVTINGGSGNIDLGAGRDSLTIATGTWTGAFTASHHNEYNTIVVPAGSAIGAGEEDERLMALQTDDRLIGAGTISKNVTYTGSGGVTIGRDTESGGSDDDNTLTFEGSVTLAGGADKAWIKSIASGGSMAMGAGNDALTVSGVLAGDVTTGAGNDTVTLGEVKSDVGVTLASAGNVDMGAGTDYFWILPGTSWTGNFGACSTAGSPAVTTCAAGAGVDTVRVGAGATIGAGAALGLGGDDLLRGAGTINRDVTYSGSSLGGITIGLDPESGQDTANDLNTLTFGGAVSLQGGAATSGAITAWAKSVSGTGSITGGSGNDDLHLSGDVAGPIAMGEGNNELSVGGTLSANVTSGAGNDTVAMKGGSGSLNLGNGANTLTIEASAAATMSGSYGSCATTGTPPNTATTCASGGSGADTVTIKATGTAAGNARILTVSGPMHLGDGLNSLTVEGDALMSGKLDFGAGDNTVEIKAGAEISGDITLGGSGSNVLIGQGEFSGDIDLGTPNDRIGALSAGSTALNSLVLSGSVTLSTGISGFRAKSISSTGSVTAGTQGGNEEYTIHLSGAADGPIQLEGGGDTVTIGGGAGGVDLKGGTNKLTIASAQAATWSGNYGECQTTNAATTCAGGAGIDTIEIHENITVSGILSLGDGADILMGVGQTTGRGMISAGASVLMGPGDDVIGGGSGLNDNLAFSGMVSLGEGNNTMRAGLGAVITAGAGNDTVELKAGAGDVSLGAGENRLTVGADGGGGGWAPSSGGGGVAYTGGDGPDTIELTAGGAFNLSGIDMGTGANKLYVAGASEATGNRIQLALQGPATGAASDWLYLCNEGAGASGCGSTGETDQAYNVSLDATAANEWDRIEIGNEPSSARSHLAVTGEVEIQKASLGNLLIRGEKSGVATKPTSVMINGTYELQALSSDRSQGTLVEFDVDIADSWTPSGILRFGENALADLASVSGVNPTVRLALKFADTDPLDGDNITAPDGDLTHPIPFATTHADSDIGRVNVEFIIPDLDMVTYSFGAGFHQFSIAGTDRYLVERTLVDGDITTHFLDEAVLTTIRPGDPNTVLDTHTSLVVFEVVLDSDGNSTGWTWENTLSGYNEDDATDRQNSRTFITVHKDVTAAGAWNFLDESLRTQGDYDGTVGTHDIRGAGTISGKIDLGGGDDTIGEDPLRADNSGALTNALALDEIHLGAGNNRVWAKSARVIMAGTRDPDATARPGDDMVSISGDITQSVSLGDGKNTLIVGGSFTGRYTGGVGADTIRLTAGEGSSLTSIDMGGGEDLLVVEGVRAGAETITLSLTNGAKSGESEVLLCGEMVAADFTCAADEGNGDYTYDVELDASAGEFTWGGVRVMNQESAAQSKIVVKGGVVFNDSIFANAMVGGDGEAGSSIEISGEYGMAETSSAASGTVFSMDVSRSNWTHDTLSFGPGARPAEGSATAPAIQVNIPQGPTTPGPEHLLNLVTAHASSGVTGVNILGLNSDNYIFMANANWYLQSTESAGTTTYYLQPFAMQEISINLPGDQNTNLPLVFGQLDVRVTGEGAWDGEITPYTGEGTQLVNVELAIEPDPGAIITATGDWTFGDVRARIRGRGEVSGPVTLGVQRDLIGVDASEPDRDGNVPSQAALDAGNSLVMGEVDLGEGHNRMWALSASSVSAGDGNDTVSLSDLRGGDGDISLGDGGNSLRLGAAAPVEWSGGYGSCGGAGAQKTCAGGAGRDDIEIGENVTASGPIHLGAGNNSVKGRGAVTGSITALGGHDAIGINPADGNPSQADIDAANGLALGAVSLGEGNNQIWAASAGAIEAGGGNDRVTLSMPTGDGNINLGDGNNRLELGAESPAEWSGGYGACQTAGGETACGAGGAGDDTIIIGENITASGPMHLGAGTNAIRGQGALSGEVTMLGGSDAIGINPGGADGLIRTEDDNPPPADIQAANSLALGDVSLGDGNNRIWAVSAGEITAGTGNDRVELTMPSGGGSVGLGGGENTLVLSSPEATEWSGGYGVCRSVEGTVSCFAGGESSDTIIIGENVTASGPLHLGGGVNAIRGQGTVSGAVTMLYSDDTIGINPGGLDGDTETAGDNPAQGEIDAANSLVLGDLNLGGGNNSVWAISAGAIAAGDETDRVELSMASGSGSVNLGNGENMLLLAAAEASEWSGGYGECAGGAGQTVCSGGGTGPDTVIVGESVTASGPMHFGEGDNVLKGQGVVSAGVVMLGGSDLVGLDPAGPDGDPLLAEDNPQQAELERANSLRMASLRLGGGDNRVWAVSTGAIWAGDGNDSIELAEGITGDVSLGRGVNNLVAAGAVAGNIATAGEGEGSLRETVTVGSLTGNVNMGNGENALAVGGGWTGEYTGGSGKDTVTLGSGEASTLSSVNMGGGDNRLLVTGARGAEPSPILISLSDGAGGAEEDAIYLCSETIAREECAEDPDNADYAMNVTLDASGGNSWETIRVENVESSERSVLAIKGELTLESPKLNNMIIRGDGEPGTKIGIAGVYEMGSGSGGGTGTIFELDISGESWTSDVLTFESSSTSAREGGAFKTPAMQFRVTGSGAAPVDGQTMHVATVASGSDIMGINFLGLEETDFTEFKRLSVDSANQGAADWILQDATNPDGDRIFSLRFFPRRVFEINEPTDEDRILEYGENHVIVSAEWRGRLAASRSDESINIITVDSAGVALGSWDLKSGSNSVKGAGSATGDIEFGDGGDEIGIDPGGRDGDPKTADDNPSQADISAANSLGLGSVSLGEGTNRIWAASSGPIRGGAGNDTVLLSGRARGAIDLDGGENALELGGWTDGRYTGGSGNDTVTIHSGEEASSLASADLGGGTNRLYVIGSPSGTAAGTVTISMSGASGADDSLFLCSDMIGEDGECGESAATVGHAFRAILDARGRGGNAWEAVTIANKRAAEGTSDASRLRSELTVRGSVELARAELNDLILMSDGNAGDSLAINGEFAMEPPAQARAGGVTRDLGTIFELDVDVAARRADSLAFGRDAVALPGSDNIARIRLNSVVGDQSSLAAAGSVDERLLIVRSRAGVISEAAIEGANTEGAFQLNREFWRIGSQTSESGDETEFYLEPWARSIAIEGGSGHSDQRSQPGIKTVTITGTFTGTYSGNDSIDQVTIAPEAVSRGNLRLGGGNNQLTVRERSSISGPYSSGDGNDTILFRAGSSFSMSQLNPGGGVNRVFIEGTAGESQPGSRRLSLSGASAGGNDSIHICNGTVNIDTGDCSVVSGDTVFNIALDGSGAGGNTWETISVNNPFSSRESVLSIRGNVTLKDSRMGNLRIASNGVAGDETVITGSFGITGNTVFELDLDTRSLESDRVIFRSARSMTAPGLTRTPSLRLLPVNAGGEAPDQSRINIVTVSDSEIDGVQIEGLVNNKVSVNRQQWSLGRDNSVQGQSTYYLLIGEIPDADRLGVDLTMDDEVIGQIVLSVASSVSSVTKVAGNLTGLLGSARGGVLQDEPGAQRTPFWTHVTAGSQKEKLTKNKGSEYKQTFRFVNSGGELFVSETDSGRVAHSIILQHGTISSGNSLSSNLTSFGYGLEYQTAGSAHFGVSVISSQLAVTNEEAGASGRFSLQGMSVSARAGWDFSVTEALTISPAASFSKTDFGGVTTSGGESAFRSIQASSGDIGVGFEYAMDLPGGNQRSVYGRATASQDFESSFEFQRRGRPAPVSVTSDKDWIHLEGGMSWQFGGSSFFAGFSAASASGEGSAERQTMSIGYNLDW